MAATKRNAQAWKEAKKRCRLNNMDVRMAKELGMTPKSLIKNIPAPNQHWKVSVKEWIRHLYEEKFDKVPIVKTDFSSGTKKKEKKQMISENVIDHHDLPF